MNDIITKPIRRAPFMVVLDKCLSSLGHENTASPAETDKPGQEPENPPPVDYDQIVEEFGGSEDLVKTVFNQFIKQAADQIPQLKQALENEDAETIRCEAHKLRGGALNLAAVPLGMIAERLEDLGESKNLDGADRLVIEFEKEFNRLKCFINEQKS